MSERTYLEELTIRSVGVIDQARIELSNGLTVLSGETGAGKTMILTALNLILGGKSDSALIRKGSERLVVSATFSIPKTRIAALNLIGVEIENGELIITRTVSLDGKSKASASGITVPASVLALLREHLIEVHAQAANLSISKAAKQRELLDRFGGAPLQAVLAQYQVDLRNYQELKARIEVIVNSLNSRDRELLELREFVESFKKINPKSGELTEIEAEISKLSSVEQLRIAVSSAKAALSDDELGSLTSLGVARKELELVRAKDLEIESIYQNLSESFYLMADASSALASYLSALEADPNRLESLNTRKADFIALVKRYGKSETPDQSLIALTARYQSAADSIADLAGGDNRLRELEKELVVIKNTLKSSARKLSEARQKLSKELDIRVTNEIKVLSMPDASFISTISSPEYENSLKESDFTGTGCDLIEFFIVGHKDGPRVPIAKGASGGEMSRIMLALEVVLAASDPVGTYIFDEIDAGVGGKAAIEVGRRLFELSKSAQVIVVTHLPQVAAWADSHFVVAKNSDGSVTQSDVRKVDSQERVAEIARMLAGLGNSTSAREHASELLRLKIG